MVTFEFIDWFWITLFVLVMVITGILFYRPGKRSQADFFLAGRGFPGACRLLQFMLHIQLPIHLCG